MSRKDDKGTLTPEPKAPNKFIDTTYIPVTMPTFKGNFIFTKAGSRTFPTAMPNPIKAVPMKRDVTSNKDRNITPIVKTIKAIKIDSSITSLSYIYGTNGDRNANASNGSVVSDTIKVLLMDRSSRIKVIKEPTDVSGPLKLALIKMIPIKRSHVACCFS